MKHILSILLVLTAALCFGQTEIKREGSFSGGGTQASSDTYRLHSSFGQSVSGNTSSTSFALRSTIVNAPPVTLFDGLVAYYPFNNNANDESGNGNDGVLGDGSTTTTFPVASNDRFENATAAYAFDGSDDYINIPSGLNGIKGFSFWFKSNAEINSSSAPQTIMSTSTGGLLIVLGDFTGGDEVFSLSDSGPNNNWYWSESQFGGPIDATWHHVFLQWNQSAGMYDLFFDGAKLSQVQTVNTPVEEPDWGTLNIGAISDSWDGLLDDIRFYDRELSDLEIAEIFTTERVIGSESNISEFTIAGQVSSEIIDTESKIIVVMPNGTDLTSLKPTITTSDFASISPDTTQARDFTNAVTYTVTSEDTNSVTAWEVVVYALPVVSDGLVAYYPFNGNADDESGSKNDLVLADNLTTASFPNLTSDRNGIENQAYSFDGVNDYISGDFAPPITNFTIGAWIYLRSDQETKAIVELISPIQQGFQFEVVGDKLYFVKTNDANVEVGATAENSSIPLDEWVFVSAINEGIDVSFYINGELTDTFTNTDNIRTDIDRLIIGGADGGGDPFNGNIDDVRIFNRALSTLEIQEIYDTERELGPESSISEFTIAGQVSSEIIDTESKIIVAMPNGTNLTSLKPTITISDFASISPDTTQAQDFTNAVTYTVTSEDTNSVTAWEVFVYALPVVSDGLIAYYPFNENANDESGNGNDGTNSGAVPERDRYGTASRAFRFDGLDDAIEASIDTSITLDGEFAVSGWYTYQSINSNDEFILDVPWGHVYVNNGMLNTELDDSGSITDGPNDTTVPDIGTWNHFILTNDGATATLYFNGVASSTTDVSFAAGGADRNVFIGRGVEANTFFSGDIDDIRIYNRALTFEEAQQIYAAEKPLVQSEGLVAYYEFNNNADNAISSDFYGTPIGGVTSTVDRNGNDSQAYNFDGEQGSTINLANSQDMFAGDIFTVSLWVNPQAGGASNTQFILGNQVQIIYIADNNTVDFQIVPETGSISVPSTSTKVPSDQWTHITVSYDDATLKKYINGVLDVSEDGFPGIDLVTNSQNVTLGSQGDVNSNGTNFKGDIDDVRIYDVALSDAQVLEIYDAEKPIPVNNGLIGYYPFTGGSLGDESGNGINLVAETSTGQTVQTTTDRFGNTGNALLFEEIDLQLNGSVSNYNGGVTGNYWIEPGIVNDSSGDVYEVFAYLGNTSLLISQSGQISVAPAQDAQIFNSESGLLEDNTWQMITCTIDTDDILNLYLNGTRVITDQSITFDQGDGSFYIAPSDNSSNQRFSGAIDDARLYSTVLTQEDIQNLYNAEKLPISSEALITSFTIPDQVGETVIDDDAETIEVVMPANTDKTGLTPTIEVSSGATVVPESVLAQDFTNPVTYTVTAQDGVTTRSYVATVTTLSQGLVAYYPFDGNANDQSGNGYDMAPQGDATLGVDRFEEGNRAYQFDGDQDYLQNSNDAFNIPESFTVAAWINPSEAENTGRNIVTQHPNTTDPIYLQFVIDTEARLVLDFEGTAGSDVGVMSSSNTVEYDKWQHVVASFDGTTVKLYKNGAIILENDVNWLGRTSSTANTPVTIGALADGLGSFLGEMDEVRIYDQALTDAQIEAIYVSEAPAPNNPPSDISLSNSEIVDGSASGTAVGVFSTTDADDGDVHVYSLISGTGDTDNASFSLTQEGELSTNFTSDFATKSSYSILVQTDDSREEGTYSEQFTITVVQPTGQKPTAINFSASDPITVSENADIGTILGTFSTVDPDDPDGNDTYIYSIVSGNTSVFEINGSDLVTIDFLDFEAEQSYDLTIRTRDPGNQELDSLFTINVGNENESPFINDFAGSVFENANIGTVVGTMFGGDLDGETNLSFALLDNTETFELDAADGTSTRLVVLDNAALDYELQQSIDFQIRVSDAGGLDSTRTFTVEIQNVNPQPEELILTNSVVLAGSPGVNIGTLSVIGDESRASYSYSILSGDSGFSLDTNSEGTQLQIMEGVSAGTYSFDIQATDESGIDQVQNSIDVVVKSVNAASSVSFGTSVTDYRIIGLPTAGVRVNEVFIELDEATQGTGWRMVDYRSAGFSDLGLNSTMVGGKGYWFLSATETAIDLARLTPIVDTEVTVSLVSGWNLISNPYLEQLNVNNAVALLVSEGVIQDGDIGPLYAYNENLKNSLEVLEGGWIENTTGSPINLVLPSPTIAARSTTDRYDFTKSWVEDDENWQLLLTMTSNNRVSNLGAVGMRSEATDEKDEYDISGPPLISKEASFRMIEEGGMVRNFKAPSSDKKWRYQIEAPAYNHVTIAWDNELIKALPQELYFYVPSKHITVNMSAFSTVDLPANATFEVIYGDEIEKATLQIPVVAYPNPAANHLSVRFHVEGDLSEYSVKLSIFNVDGKEVISSQQRFLSNALGLFQLDDLGLAAGTYFYHVSYDGRISQMQKLIVK